MRWATLGSLKLPNHSIRLMAAMLEECGGDPAAALGAAGLAPDLLKDTTQGVTGLEEIAFQRAFLDQTRDRPDVWLELGSRYRALSHASSDYGLAMVTSSDVQEAVEAGLQIEDLNFSLAKGRPVYGEGGDMVGLMAISDEVPADLKRFNAVRDLSTTMVVLSDLWGEPFPLDHVELCVAPQDEALARAYLPDVPITFGAENSAFYWSVRLRDRKPAQSDKFLHSYYAERCAAAIAAIRPPENAVDQLVELLADADAPLSLEEAAQKLGLSTRTLQRQLQQRGLNYREVATLSRHRTACRLLRETTTPITRIAIDVGYHNVSSFNHAFRRHAGVSPRAYRRDATTGSGQERRSPAASQAGGG